MVAVVGPIARLMEGGFYENFVEAAGEVTPELDDVAARAGRRRRGVRRPQLADRAAATI